MVCWATPGAGRSGPSTAPAGERGSNGPEHDGDWQIKDVSTACRGLRGLLLDHDGAEFSSGPQPSWTPEPAGGIGPIRDAWQAVRRALSTKRRPIGFSPVSRRLSYCGDLAPRTFTVSAENGSLLLVGGGWYREREDLAFAPLWSRRFRTPHEPPVGSTH
jgi:hypothetical protein